MKKQKTFFQWVMAKWSTWLIILFFGLFFSLPFWQADMVLMPFWGKLLCWVFFGGIMFLYFREQKKDLYPKYLEYSQKFGDSI